MTIRIELAGAMYKSSSRPSAHPVRRSHNGGNGAADDADAAAAAAAAAAAGGQDCCGRQITRPPSAQGS